MPSFLKYRYCLLIIFYFGSRLLAAQDGLRVEHARKSKMQYKSTKEIVSALVKNTKDDREKLLSLYAWIAHHIHYDTRYKVRSETYKPNELIADQTLKNRSGVCFHFAKLFEEMCSLLDIKVYYIVGYTRNATGLIDEVSHAWNGVLLDGKYYLVDPTWAAGAYVNGVYESQYNQAYFLMTPEESIKTHMPFDPLYQFSDRPISHKEFEAQIYTSTSDALFSFYDTLTKYNNVYHHDFWYSSSKRMEAYSSENKLVAKEIKYAQNEGDYQYYNFILDTLNIAIRQINAVITLYNDAVTSKSKKVNQEIVAQLVKHRVKLRYCDQSLATIVSENETIIDLVVNQRNKIIELNKILDDLEAYYK